MHFFLGALRVNSVDCDVNSSDSFMCILSSKFMDHCSAYLVSIVFHFSLEGKTMVSIVTFPFFAYL